MSSSDDEDVCVVLDNGSYRIKAGFAGDDEPRSFFRTVVGTPLYEGQTISGRPLEKCYIGDQVIENMDALDVRRPIERGIVTDWDVMETVWHQVFNDLHVDSSDCYALITEPPLNPKSNREKMAQIIFEKLQSQGMYALGPNVLTLFSSGRGSGLVIDSGYEVTTVGCVFEGWKLTQTMFRYDIGGNDITNYLIELLGKCGYSFTTTKEIEEVNMMKEQCAFVSENPEAENMDNIKKDYTLSNGSSISLGYERFQCMEALFKPNLIGSNACGIHEMIEKSIKACPADIISMMSCNVILAGSNTMVEGLVSRLTRELQKLLPSTIRTKIVAPPERPFSTWIGGSIFGSLSSTRQIWTRPADYDEFGPNVVYRPEYFLYW
ncbi:actin-like [Ylistrum balloti]|uniref:actin-like n=1 Tax=Ylistrum balloti TaxID=509963 RepID=UPI002905E9F7|nr:actin-like [Ylistrum balloti]